MNGKAVERGQVRSGTLSPCYSITQLSPHPPSPQDMPHQSAESSLKKSPVPVPGDCRSVPQLRVMGRGPGRPGEGLRKQGPLIFLSPLFLTPDPGLSGGWRYRGCGLLPGFMRYDHSAETQHPRAPCHPQEDTLGVDVGGGVMCTTTTTTTTRNNDNHYCWCINDVCGSTHTYTQYT